MSDDWTTRTHGHHPDDWERAKAQMREALIEAARSSKGTIAYSDLADRVTAIPNPKKKGWFYALNDMLGQISVEEHRAKRPLLSAVAVYKDEMAPGPGFDAVVKELGLGDPLSVWIRELKASQERYRQQGKDATTGSGASAPDAREILEELVGETIETLSGSPNIILGLDDDLAIVATEKSPGGQPVPIEWVQDALDKLFERGRLEIEVETVGHRSAFIGAVLRTLPGARAAATPRRIILQAYPQAGAASEEVTIEGKIYSSIREAAEAPVSIATIAEAFGVTKCDVQMVRIQAGFLSPDSPMGRWFPGRHDRDVKRGWCRCNAETAAAVRELSGR